MAKFRVSRAAQADIRDIARYTEKRWGRAQRQNYLKGMDNAFKDLSATPLQIAIRDDFNPPVRIFNYEKHLIIYVLDDLGITIVRVLHQRMNVPAYLS